MTTRVWHANDPECPADAIYVARAFAGRRASLYGNPFKVVKVKYTDGTTSDNRAAAVAAYAEWFHADTPQAEARRDAAVLELGGHDLVCWCAPNGGVTAADLPWVCHGQVVAEFLDRETPDTVVAHSDRQPAVAAERVDATEFTFAEFRTRGLLWLLNTTALHPRGYALALAWPDGTGIEGIAAGVEPTGWTIMGDGSEPWTMGDPPDRPGYLDSLFVAVEQTLADARARNAPPVDGDASTGTPPLEPVSPGPKHGPARVNERRLRSTTNASVWVEEFSKVYPDCDTGTMLGWFANAIEHGRDAGYAAALGNPTCDDLDAPAPPVDHSQHPEPPR